MSLSWKFFMVSVFQLALCLLAILTHLILGSVFNDYSIQKLSLLLLSPAGWIAKQFQSRYIFFFIFKFLAYYTLEVFREGLMNWRMTGQLSPRVILIYSYFIIVSLGEVVDGDVEIKAESVLDPVMHFFCHLYFSLKNLNATFMLLSLQAVWMYLSSYLSYSIPEFKNSFPLNY